MAPRGLSAEQRRLVQQAIRDGHLAFSAEVFGPTSIDRDDYDRLRAAGKIRDDRLLPQDAASAAHAIGAIAGHEQAGAGPPRGAGRPAPLSDPDEFWRHLRDDPQIVTEAEREAVALLRDRVAHHVRSLGHKLDDAVARAMLDADDQARRRRLVGELPPPRASVVSAVEGRVRVAVAELRRDWLRVAHTELHNAAEEAKAVVLADRDPDSRVFKRVHPDACSFCELLYVRPDRVTPRVFRLSSLAANGSNVGRRAGRPTRSGKSRTEWRAVIGAAHPFCKCELYHLPDGMGFDARGQMVYVGVKKSSTIEVEPMDGAALNHAHEE